MAEENGKTDILVVGAGVVGLCIALEMLHRGRSVRIIDKDFSGRIRTHVGEVALFGGDPVMVNLVKQSRAAWKAAEDRYDADFGYKERGTLELATSAGRKVLVQQEQAEEPDVVEAIFSHESLCTNAGITLSEEVVGGKFEAEAPVLSTHTVLEALREQVAKKGAIIWGSDTAVEFLVDEGDSGSTLQGVRVQSGEVALADEVFVAAGPLTGLLLGALHLNLPLRPARQHLITFSIPEDFGNVMLTHRLRRAHLCYKKLNEGHIMVSYDGLMDPTQATHNQMVDDDIVELVKSYTAEHLIPAFAHARVEQTSTVTAAVTPDFRPVVGRWPGVQGLWLATGFAGRDYACAMVVARTLGQVLSGEMPGLNIAPFAPDRFENDRWPRFMRPPSLAWSEQAQFNNRKGPQFASNVQDSGGGDAAYMNNVNMTDKGKITGNAQKTGFSQKGKIQMAGTGIKRK